MAGQALVEHFVIGFRRRGHERHAELLEVVPALDQVVADQRDVLDAFTVEFLEELLDLAFSAFAFFIERDADLAVGCGQCLGGEAGVLTLDVEEADLAEVEEGLVIVRPVLHAAVVDVVREVIDHVEARADRVLLHARKILEIDVVDRQAVAFCVLVAVDQVDDCAADASYCRDVQFHRAGLDCNRFGTALDEFGIGLARVADTETHATGGGTVFAGEIPRGTLRLVVQDEVDLALAPQVDILRAVPCDKGKTHCLEHRFDHALFRRAELDEFEAVEADGILEQVGHRDLLCSSFK